MANLKTRIDEAIDTLTRLREHVEELDDKVLPEVSHFDLDWPLRVFGLLQRMSEGDGLAEQELRRELEPWNRGA